MRSDLAFRNTLSAVMFGSKPDDVEGKLRKLAVFLVNTGCSDTVNGERLVHMNVVIVQCTGEKYRMFLYDPFMPSPAENTEPITFTPVKFALDTFGTVKRVDEESVVRVICGRQNGTLDCFHRGIDFIGRLVDGDVSLNTINDRPWRILRRLLLKIHTCGVGSGATVELTFRCQWCWEWYQLVVHTQSKECGWLRSCHTASEGIFGKTGLF